MLQALPLDVKILKSKQRIREWYEYWNGKVYVSFSGGKDSTVLLHIVRSLYPGVPAVFVDTGLEYPEIREFVKTVNDVTWLRPKLSFNKVIEKYGYPVISKEQSDYIYQFRHAKSEKTKVKRLYGGKNGLGKISEKWKYLIDAPFKISADCCKYMKKKPSYEYEKSTGRVPITGKMADEGNQREGQYLKTGCNAFNNKRPMPMPLGFWVEEDIWNYIKTYKIQYSNIYDMGYNRTGCMFCMYGAHLEKEPNRFQLMQRTHPKQYDYCMNKLGLAKVLDYINVPYMDNVIACKDCWGQNYQQYKMV